MRLGSDLVGVPVATAQRRARRSQDWIPKFVESSSAVTVTASASSHTKGAWTELLAAAASDFSHLVVFYDNTGSATTQTDGLLDIGVGGAAAETVLLANIGGGYTLSGQGARLGFPVRIPKGTRIAARFQALISADTIRVVVAGFNAPNVARTPGPCDTYGANTAASSFTSAMTTTNTYVEQTSATTQAYQGVVVVPMMSTAAAPTLSGLTLTVGIGSAGNETTHGTVTFSSSNQEAIIQTTLDVTQPNSLATVSPFANFLPGHIPAGSRIATKLSTGASHLGCVVIGVPY